MNDAAVRDQQSNERDVGENPGNAGRLDELLQVTVTRRHNRHPIELDIGKAAFLDQPSESQGRFVAQARRFTERPALQFAEGVDQAPPIQRVDPQLSTRLQQASELAERRVAGGKRLRDPEAQGPIELLLTERKLSNIGDCENGSLQATPRSLAERRHGIVHADNIVAVAQQDPRIGSRATARVEPSPSGLAGPPESKKPSQSCIEPSRGPTGDTRVVVAQIGKLFEPSPPLLLEVRAQGWVSGQMWIDRSTLRAEAGWDRNCAGGWLDVALLQPPYNDNFG